MLATVVTELAGSVDFAATRPTRAYFLNSRLLLRALSLVALNESNKLPRLHMVRVYPQDLADRDQGFFPLSFLIERHGRRHQISGPQLKLFEALQIHQPL